MGRPGYLQRWAYNAGAGLVVQPPDGVAGAGYPTGYRPPAEWFNWCFANWAEWIRFLRGANYEHWTRASWGTSPATFDTGSPLFLAVDPDTIESADMTGAAFRYVIAGQETNTPNTTALRVSRRGGDWVRRTNVTAGATDLPTALAHAPNGSGSGRWLLGLDNATIHYCTVDAGGATGPVGSGSGNWSTATTPGGMTDVVAFAPKNEAAIFALTNDGGAVSTDHGVTWSAYDGTSGTARSGIGSDCVWTGSAFLFVTTDGQIYASSTVGGTFVYKTDLGATATWRLATDGNGGVLAYRANSGSTLDIFWSADSGGTWETITPTSGFQRIQRIRHHDGTWLACSTVAPFLWSSNDHENWIRLRMPVSGSDLSLYDLAWDGGAWVVAGNGWVLQCPRGHDPGDADAPWSPGSGSAPLVDAGYLRGREVAATAPTNGQVLTWNNTSGVWEPATPSGGGTSSPLTTNGDLWMYSTTDARLAIGSTSQVLTVVAGLPAWRSLPWASHTSTSVQTTDATQTSCGTYTVPAGAYTVELLVTGAKSDLSAACGWKLTVTVVNNSGTVSIVGGGALIVGPTDGATTWAVTVDVSGTSLRLRVTGAAATTIDWTARWIVG